MAIQMQTKKQQQKDKEKVTEDGENMDTDPVENAVVDLGEMDSEVTKADKMEEDVVETADDDNDDNNDENDIKSTDKQTEGCGTWVLVIIRMLPVCEWTMWYER